MVQQLPKEGITNALPDSSPGLVGVQGDISNQTYILLGGEEKEHVPERIANQPVVQSVMIIGRHGKTAANVEGDGIKDSFEPLLASELQYIGNPSPTGIYPEGSYAEQAQKEAELLGSAKETAQLVIAPNKRCIQSAGITATVWGLDMSRFPTEGDIDHRISLYQTVYHVEKYIHRIEQMHDTQFTLDGFHQEMVVLERAITKKEAAIEALSEDASRRDQKIMSLRYERIQLYQRKKLLERIILEIRNKNFPLNKGAILREIQEYQQTIGTKIQTLEKQFPQRLVVDRKLDSRRKGNRRSAKHKIGSTDNDATESNVGAMQRHADAIHDWQKNSRIPKNGVVKLIGHRNLLEVAQHETTRSKKELSTSVHATIPGEVVMGLIDERGAFIQNDTSAYIVLTPENYHEYMSFFESRIPRLSDTLSLVEKQNLINQELCSIQGDIEHFLKEKDFEKLHPYLFEAHPRLQYIALQTVIEFIANNVDANQKIPELVLTFLEQNMKSESSSSVIHIVTLLYRYRETFGLRKYCMSIVKRSHPDFQRGALQQYEEMMTYRNSLEERGKQLEQFTVSTSAGDVAMDRVYVDRMIQSSEDVTLDSYTFLNKVFEGEKKRYLLQAGGGYGKSTLMKKLYTQSFDPLLQYQYSLYDVPIIRFESTTLHEPPSLQECITTYSLESSKRAVFFLDGIDECNEALIESRYNLLMELQETYDIRVVAASRYFEQKRSKDDEGHPKVHVDMYTLPPLLEDEIDRYQIKYTEKNKNAKPLLEGIQKDLFKTLVETYRGSNDIVTPIDIDMMSSIARDRTWAMHMINMGTNLKRSDLYECYTELIYQRGYEKMSSSSSLNPEILEYYKPEYDQIRNEFMVYLTMFSPTSEERTSGTRYALLETELHDFLVDRPDYYKKIFGREYDMGYLFNINRLSDLQDMSGQELLTPQYVEEMQTCEIFIKTLLDNNGFMRVDKDQEVYFYHKSFEDYFRRKKFISSTEDEWIHMLQMRVHDINETYNNPILEATIKPFALEQPINGMVALLMAPHFNGSQNLFDMLHSYRKAELFENFVVMKPVMDLYLLEVMGSGSLDYSTFVQFPDASHELRDITVSHLKRCKNVILQQSHAESDNCISKIDLIIETIYLLCSGASVDIGGRSLLTDLEEATMIVGKSRAERSNFGSDFRQFFGISQRHEIVSYLFTGVL